MRNKNLAKITHGQLYKNALWATIVVFSAATLIAVSAILFNGFTSFTFRMLFVMWQVFWFGLMAILFARFYEQNTFVVARYIAVAAVICCALLLMIGVYQAIFPAEYHFDRYGQYTTSDFNVTISKIQAILSCFVYVGIVVEWHLRVKSDVQAVMMTRDITAAVMMFAMVILDVMIIVDFDDMEGIVGRLIAVMSILAVTGVVVTRILNSIYKKNNRPTVSTRYVQTVQSGVEPQGLAGTSEPREQASNSRASSGQVNGVNRAYLVERIKAATGRSEEECIAIVNVFENGHLLRKQAKEDLVKGLVSNLAMSEEEADKTYDEYIGIMMSEFLKR